MTQFCCVVGTSLCMSSLRSVIANNFSPVFKLQSFFLVVFLPAVTSNQTHPTPNKNNSPPLVYGVNYSISVHLGTMVYKSNRLLKIQKLRAYSSLKNMPYWPLCSFVADADLLTNAVTIRRPKMQCSHKILLCIWLNIYRTKDVLNNRL